ncbi:hypothetical protein HK097_006338, partial [Rhizophlyctis rosea]
MSQTNLSLLAGVRSHHRSLSNAYRRYTAPASSTPPLSSRHITSYPALIARPRSPLAPSPCWSPRAYLFGGMKRTYATLQDNFFSDLSPSAPLFFNSSNRGDSSGALGGGVGGGVGGPGGIGGGDNGESGSGRNGGGRGGGGRRRGRGLIKEREKEKDDDSG